MQLKPTDRPLSPPAGLASDSPASPSLPASLLRGNELSAVIKRTLARNALLLSGVLGASCGSAGADGATDRPLPNTGADVASEGSSGDADAGDSRNDAGSRPDDDAVEDDAVEDDAVGSDADEEPPDHDDPGRDAGTEPPSGAQPEDVAAAMDLDDQLPDATTTQPGAEQGSAPPAESLPSELWTYIETEGSYVLRNLVGADEDLLLPRNVPLDQPQRPWSRDGSKLAQLEGEQIVFYDLGRSATVLARHDMPEAQALANWLPDFGALVVGARDSESLLMAVRTDGTTWVLGEGENGLISSLSTSPDGKHVVWSSPVDAEGYDVWRYSFTGDQPSQPELLAHYTTAPLLNETWTSNSAWMAYGAYGAAGEAGVYLLEANSSQPMKVSSDDVVYGPSFEFSRDGSALATWLPATTGASAQLSVLGLAPSGPTQAQVVLTSEVAGEVDWAAYGNQFMLSADGGGALQQLSEDGSVGPTIEFPAYDSTCEVLWLNQDEFIYSGCLESESLTFAQVHDGIIETTEVLHGALPNLALSPDGKCVMDWDPNRVRIGPASVADYTPAPVPANGWEAISFAGFAPDGSVVWIEYGTRLYRMPQANCFPTADAELVSTSEEEVRVMAFIALE